MEAPQGQEKAEDAQFRGCCRKLTIQNTLTLWETYGIH